MSRNEFRRIAIVNRGEPAMRLITAVRELNAESDSGYQTLALYTDADRDALFVREADEAYCLGSVSFTDPKDGSIKNRYLDYPGLERTLIQARAEAAWVGWGFVAEHAEFADLCERLNIAFIGPPGEVIRQLGDKIRAKTLAEAADVPVAAWSGGGVASVSEAEAEAQRLGFPLMIKATAGGGGRGIRKVRELSEVASAFESAQREALKSFGDATVFMERMVQNARHVEVQLIADQHGTVWPVGLRDCSIQRSNQKVIEESASTVLSPEEAETLMAAAQRLGEKVGYQNAGTVEFLYDQEAKRFAFMEVNARLQVEHPVTEATTGLDLVKMQILVARGLKLRGQPPAPKGHAIEVRLCAEDPENAFMPAPGKIRRLRVPSGPGLRVDTGFEEGDEVSPAFDSMVAKIIAFGRTRSEAIARMRRVLSASTVVIDGGSSNKGFLMTLLSRPELIEGKVDIGFLDRLLQSGEHVSDQDAEIALLGSAIESYEAELRAERQQFFASAERGRPEVSADVGRKVELGYRGGAYNFVVHHVDHHRYRVEVDDARVDVTLRAMGGDRRRIEVAGRQHRILSVAQGLTYSVEVDGVPHVVAADSGRVVRAPAPAVVVAVAVKEGDEVKKGDRLAILEAMKTETSLNAAFDGIVRQVMVVNNMQVAPGAPLMQIDPPAGGEVKGARRVSFAKLYVEETADLSVKSRYLAHLDRLESSLLGYDVNLVDLDTIRQDIELLRAQMDWDDALRSREEAVLVTFADISSIFERDPHGGEGEDARLSAEDVFFAYLRDPSDGVDDLPAWFGENLRRALSHYGVSSFERTPALEEALFRMQKAERRGELQASTVTTILGGWLAHDAEQPIKQESGLRELLERLVMLSERRLPAVNQLARELRYRRFGAGLLGEARRACQLTAARILDRLAEGPGMEEERDLVDQLVDSPLRLRRFLSERYEDASPPVRRAILEVLLRTYNRRLRLGPCQIAEKDGLLYALSHYVQDDKAFTLIATHTVVEEAEAAGRLLAELAAEQPAETGVVLELYLRRSRVSGPLPKPSDYEALVNSFPLSRPVDELILSVSERVIDAQRGDIEHYSFAWKDGCLCEERSYRGLHPRIADSMDMFRLAAFETVRLPSADDIYLFHAVSRSNPKDTRLFALAEVRDLSAERDSDGRVVRLPYVEAALLEAFASMRWTLTNMPQRQRPSWNRVRLYIRPAIAQLDPGDLQTVIERMLPEALGLGLEKVLITVRLKNRRTGVIHDRVIEIANPDSQGATARLRLRPKHPMESLTEYARQVARLRQRGLMHPYEVVKMLAPVGDSLKGTRRTGSFVEYDLDETGQALVSVKRPEGENKANIVVGVVKNFTQKSPEGITRVILLGDPSRGMGALAEPECTRILAAIDLADSLGVPIEWFAVSGGARISMESGTENMDWIAAVLRRIIRFTQAGGTIHVVVTGVNVGAQPYWNAESTMLMHTKGILIQTQVGTMVLTGKRALDFSGGVSAEDNEGIGGYNRIMGPNGQAQYYARDVGEACELLLRYYEHSYVHKGERFPRPAETEDPRERSIADSPHGEPKSEFETVGDVFSMVKNPARKKPFDIRKVMAATIDQDHRPMERWFDMHAAENAVVWDAHLGGHSVCLLGLESRPLPRLGLVPADGPKQWTAGTLFPLSSKKVARALNSASGNRPAVILANLSGFDGSPESMRNVQLEYGAEIGRAIVNFDGPIVFCVISRYHGGAFVVFSARLNDHMEVAALEGSRASVIGGAPAAAVVFSREVDKRTAKDPRVLELEEELRLAAPPDRAQLFTQLGRTVKAVRSEKLGEVAEAFDKVHSVERALEVGSIHHIVPVSGLRQYLIEAVERGMAHFLAS